MRTDKMADITSVAKVSMPSNSLFESMIYMFFSS